MYVSRLSHKLAQKAEMAMMDDECYGSDICVLPYRSSDICNVRTNKMR